MKIPTKIFEKNEEEPQCIEVVKDGYLGSEHQYARGLVTSDFKSRMKKTIEEYPLLLKIIEAMQEIDFPMVCHPKAIKYLRKTYGYGTEEYFNEAERFNPSSRRKYVILIEEMLKTAQLLLVELGQFNGTAYIFNGSYWESIDRDMLESFLSSVAEKCGLKSFDVRQPQELKKLTMQFMASAKQPQPEVKPEEVLINLKNGTYAISQDKREFRDACSDDLIQYALPFDYDPKAKAPMFTKFLNQVLPDKTQQKVLVEYLGYIFVKGLKLEKCLLIIGEGANGKSVLFDIVSALLGDRNISSYTLSNLCDDKGYHRAQLTNKLVNYSSELGGKNCAPDMVKKLISTEPVDARSPFGQPFELKNYCKFIFNTNTLPKEVEQTGAYFRRFLIIRFGITIPESKQDKDLAKKIISSELSGVFHLVLQGLERVLANKKFTDSQAIENEIKVFRKESNSVALFIEDENYEPDLKSYIDLKALYTEYREYCFASGHIPVSKVEFSRRLKGIGIAIKPGTANIRCVYCVKAHHRIDKKTEKMIKKSFKL